MKVGLIRCLQTEDMCPTVVCLKSMQHKKYAFEKVKGDIEIIGVNTCGGCPGKKVGTRAAEMIRHGADTIALASCMTKGTPIGFVCPHKQQIREALINKIGEKIRLLNYTH